MSAPAPLGEGKVAALLAGIAATAPAPGAGSAGATALALGIACARKALRITLSHHPERSALAAADARLAALGEAALAGADADAARFTALIDALRLAHDDAGEAAVRDAAVAQRAAALVSLADRLLAIGAEAERVIAASEADVQRSMMNDLAAARALIGANAAIQRANRAESSERTR